MSGLRWGKGIDWLLESIDEERAALAAIRLRHRPFSEEAGSIWDKCDPDDILLLRRWACARKQVLFHEACLNSVLDAIEVDEKKLLAVDAEGHA